MPKLIFLSILLLALTACAPSEVAANPALCDEATLVDHLIVDVPVQEGTVVMPGMHFTKTWQVTNSGTCTWTTDYALVHTGGDAMGAAAEFPLSVAVAPGETVDLAVPMTVPATDSAVTSEWMLRNADGETFGVGPDADRPLTADVTVPVLPAGVRFEFAQVACLARWDSGRAEFLPCDDAGDTQNGYIVLPPNGTIEAKPNNEGWIAGYFPQITIADGDHFTAVVGCVDEQTDCAVTFTVLARTASSDVALGDASVSGAQTAEIDIDLSQFAGDAISLILQVEESGGRSALAVGYWRNASVEAD